MTKIMTGAAAAIAAAAIAATPAVAHHSFAQFDATKTDVVKGTVFAVEWANPHIWVWVYVQNKDGSTTPWGFEGSAPGELMRAGFAKTSLKKGDKVTVTYHPMASGKPGGSFMSFVLPDGRKLGQPPMPPH